MLNLIRAVLGIDHRRFNLFVKCSSQHLTANLFDHLDQPSEALPGRRDLAVSINEEVPMFRIHAPILIIPTAEAREALGPRMRRVRSPTAQKGRRGLATSTQSPELSCLEVRMYVRF
jgi:hypothetical protein